VRKETYCGLAPPEASDAVLAAAVTAGVTEGIGQALAFFHAHPLAPEGGKHTHTAAQPLGTIFLRVSSTKPDFKKIASENTWRHVSLCFDVQDKGKSGKGDSAVGRALTGAGRRRGGPGAARRSSASEHGHRGRSDSDQISQSTLKLKSVQGIKRKTFQT
jgi:hypothetical protein